MFTGLDNTRAAPLKKLAAVGYSFMLNTGSRNNVNIYKGQILLSSMEDVPFSLHSHYELRSISNLHQRPNPSNPAL